MIDIKLERAFGWDLIRWELLEKERFNARDALLLALNTYTAVVWGWAQEGKPEGSF